MSVFTRLFMMMVMMMIMIIINISLCEAAKNVYGFIL